MFIRLLLSVIAGLASGSLFYDVIYDKFLSAFLTGLLTYYLVWKTIKLLQQSGNGAAVNISPFNSTRAEKAVKKSEERASVT